MEAIRVPKMYCPFSPQISPYAQEVHEHSLAWATRFQMIQGEAARRRFHGTNLARLTARAYPTASLEDMKLLNDWMVWFFVFDDQFDDVLGTTLESALSTVHAYIKICENAGEQSAPGPAAAALCDLYRRTLPRMSPAWRTRFTRHFIQYLDTYTWMGQNHLQGAIPELHVYLEYRYHSGGAVPSRDLIEFADRLRLPDELLLSWEFERLNRAANHAICWSNDIFSLAKELARGEVSNLVVITKHMYRLSWQEAIESVNTMVTNEVRLFEQIERHLPPIAPHLVADAYRYIAGLKAWIRANFDWSAETHRYLRVEQTRAGETVSYVEPILATAPRPE
jgi:5-epi-alpha-selinene synthase